MPYFSLLIPPTNATAMNVLINLGFSEVAEVDTHLWSVRSNLEPLANFEKKLKAQGRNC